MFGEAESESPRVPSPWDALASSTTSAAPSPALGPAVLDHTDLRKQHPSPVANGLGVRTKMEVDGVPRLAPEVEEGNVEYKLKLINPSPERFTRLCTQLKWRLLEGGGQAYYELGVADSGQLIGLTRDEMEKSLETLEMMAGEIGASVIVVKEIEVPGPLVDVSLRRAATVTGGSPSPNTTHLLSVSPSSLRASPVHTDEDEATTTPSATDGDDDGSDEVDEVVTPETDPVPRSAPRPIAHPPHAHTRARADEHDHERAADDVQEDETVAQFTLSDLEILNVYKPRPSRARAAGFLLAVSAGGSKAARRQQQPHLTVGAKGSKKVKPHALSADEKQQRMAMQHTKRDQKREEKRRALLMLAGLEDDDARKEGGEGAGDALGLCHDTVLAKDRLGAVSLNVADTGQLEVELPTRIEMTTEQPRRTRLESRIIVEALVVRKLAVEEAFLDFGGFSLGQ